MKILRHVEQTPGCTSPDYMFWCPACKCGHGIWTTKNNPGTNGRWHFNGNMDAPTILPSIKINYEGGGICHVNVINGHLYYCNDCTHTLKDQIIPMEAF